MTDLTKMTENELAMWQAGWKPESPYYLLATQEWERRTRLEQHELSESLLKKQHELNLEIHGKQADLARELHEKQSKLTISSIKTTAFVTVFAAILGAYLQARFQVLPQKELQSAPQQTLSSIENSRIQTDSFPEIKKPGLSAQAVAVLKNVSSFTPYKKLNKRP